MSRTFEAALTRAPVFFEPVPPSLRTRPDRVDAYFHELATRLQSVDLLDAIDVPELIDENHDGRPYYRTDDPREIGRHLAELVQRPVVVNKVVAHLPSQAAWSSGSSKPSPGASVTWSWSGDRVGTFRTRVPK